MLSAITTTNASLHFFHLPQGLVLMSNSSCNSVLTLHRNSPAFPEKGKHCPSQCALSFDQTSFPVSALHFQYQNQLWWKTQKLRAFQIGSVISPCFMVSLVYCWRKSQELFKGIHGYWFTLLPSFLANTSVSQQDSGCSRSTPDHLQIAPYAPKPVQSKQNSRSCAICNYTTPHLPSLLPIHLRNEWWSHKDGRTCWRFRAVHQKGKMPQSKPSLIQSKWICN